ncbi:MAG: hypothetical protein PHV02_16040 [Rhodocyclaceae bacterium]|nr:hypothetical protein [Rhodocyclaceae bacterium]
MADSKPHDQGIAAKIYGLLQQLHSLNADTQSALEKAEYDAANSEQPAPFDESAAQMALADAAVADAIAGDGTDTATALAADLAIQRTTSARAVDTWQKARIKSAGDMSRLKAEVSALDMRIQATDSALRNELASLATKRMDDAKQAFIDATGVVFQCAAEYAQLEDLTAAHDGRSIDWVSGHGFPATVAAPYWTGESRNIHQPPELINEARAEFLKSIGVIHE